MGTSQEQELGTKRFQKNQALFRRYTTVDGAIKNKCFVVVYPVFLYPLMDQLTGFGQVAELYMLQHMFNYYGLIDEIALE